MVVKVRPFISNLNMKEFHINELRGRYHQNNFSEMSPKGTNYPRELNLTHRSSIKNNSWYKNYQSKDLNPEVETVFQTFLYIGFWKLIMLKLFLLILKSIPEIIVLMEALSHCLMIDWHKHLAHYWFSLRVLSRLVLFFKSCDPQSTLKFNGDEVRSPLFWANVELVIT